MKTGNVKIPGALIATDKEGVVAYAGDINDEVTRILNEEEAIIESSLHEINLELISWKDTMTKRDPDEPDLDNYYTISEIDNLLNGKIGLSNIIQQAYSTVEGLVVSNVDFNRNTVADYTTIPSMDVFKKFVPQIHNADDIPHAIDSYGTGLFDYKTGLNVNKIPTVGSVIDLIKASNDLYIPPLINDSGDYTHATLTQAVFSASYIDNAVFGAGGYGEFPKSSMKSYVDSLKTVFAKIVYDFEADDLSELEINGESTERTEWISKIYNCVSSSTPIVIFIVDGLDASKICPCIIENVNSNECVLHFEKDNNIYTVTIGQDSVNFTSSKYGVHLYEDKIRGAYLHLDYDLTFANNDRDDLYDLKDLYKMILNGAMIPLYTDSKTYNLVSCINVPQPRPIIPPGATPPPSFVVYRLYYLDLFGTESTTNPAYIINLSYNKQTTEVTAEIEVTTTAELIQGVVTDSALFQAPISISINNSSIESSISDQLSWMHTNLIGKILIGGNSVGTFYDSSTGKLNVDLTDSLKQFCIWDNPDTMLAKLQNLNTSAADAYKYDFSGDGSYNVSTDFTAYQNLRDNLVLEVNGLRKKLANIDVGTTYATLSAFNTLADKVYAGLYGNSTGINNLTDTTKLQSLKAVVDWIGTNGKQYNSVAALITDKVAALQDDILGTYGNNGVLESAGTENNIKLGVKFNDNIGALNKIVTDKGYTTANEGYVPGIGPGTDSEHEHMTVFDYLMELDNTAIPDAGIVAQAIISATGYVPGDATFESRISTLETFKSAFDTNNFDVATVLSDISTLNTNVGNLSNAVDGIGNTISFINSNVVENIDHIITQITIKETDNNSLSYAEVNKIITGDGINPIDLTSLATRDYVDNAISNIESLGNLTPEDLNRLDALVDNISNYALLSDVNTAVTGMLTKVKIGTLEADISTTPGTAAFNVNDVKTALFGTANVLTSNSSIPWSKISFEGVTNPPITNITDDNIPSTIARKSDITITNIKQNGAAVSPANKVVDLGYKLTKITWSKDGVTQPDWTPKSANGGVFALGNIITNTNDCIKGIQYTGSSTATQTVAVNDGIATLPVFDGTSATNTDDIDPTGDPLVTFNGLKDYMTLFDDEVNAAIEDAVSPLINNAIVIPTTTITSSNVIAEPNTVYNYTGNGLEALSLSLKSNGNSNSACTYTLRFKTGNQFSFRLRVIANSNNSVLTNRKVAYPTNITWAANTEYEVSILFDGYSYSFKQIPLVTKITDSNTNEGYVTIG